MRLMILLSELSSSCWLYSILLFLIKPSVLIRAINPIFKLILEIILEIIISTYHFSILPFGFILSSGWVNQCPISMKLSFEKLPFINHSIRVIVFAFPMIPTI
jgi:hypothetical protein